MPIPQLDLTWVLVAAGMIFIMQAGFLALEAGLTRTKNAINVAIKNVTDFSISLLAFWALGFGLVFSPSIGGFIGSGSWAPSYEALGADGTAFLLFQGMFCGTAVTIVAGAVAERMKFAAYIPLTLLISCVIYPLGAHWVWGGAGEDALGWLSAAGFVDFAGSTVVHSLGGAVALAAVLVTGPRKGRFNDGENRIPPSSLTLAMLGVMLLWFGWIGFNGGSQLVMDGNVPPIILNTMLAGCAGLLAALAVGWPRLRYAEPGLILCGSLGGLVAVTASCHVVSFGSAVVIGSIGGILASESRRVLEALRIDDAVDAIPVHLVCGVWGTVAYAIFAPYSALSASGGRFGQLMVQLGGVGAVAGVSFLIAFAALYVANRITSVRVSEEDELAGLNVAEHRAPDAMHDLLTAIDEQSEQKDLSLRAPVEPFTEVGLVATRYNALMASLEGSLTSITELEEAQGKLEVARANAVEALEARSMFLANMSHELRTPMNAIIGFADLMLEEDFEPDEVQEFLTHIRGSGEHLLELINDVLDFSKLEAGKVEIETIEFDLVTTVEQCVAQLTPRARQSGIELSVTVAEGTPQSVESDPTRVRQVLLNLLSNAVKFTEEGSVHVEVRRATGQESAIEVAVTDTGIGLAPEKLETIFEEFTQAESSTARKFGGTGLGLALSRRIARLLDGDIVVTSELGSGSTFHFTFLSHVTEAERAA